jgi:hypothetical protein
MTLRDEIRNILTSTASPTEAKIDHIFGAFREAFMGDEAVEAAHHASPSDVNADGLSDEQFFHEYAKLQIAAALDAVTE